MQFSTALVAAFAALGQVAMADFQVYTMQEVVTVDGSVSTGWFFLNGEPDCKDAMSRGFINNSEDVSGNKRGVRCKGDGCFGGVDPKEIKAMEVHTGLDPKIHFTIYTPSGDMIDVDDNVIGNCKPDGGHKFWCTDGLGTRQGIRRFICKSDYTGDAITQPMDPRL